MSTTSSSAVPNPGSAHPATAPRYTGGDITNRQLLAAIEHSPIGGGKVFPQSRRPRRENADYVVRTRDQLAQRCQEAGKLVWVPDDVAINLTGVTLTVRATVASSRGIGTSEGALVHSTAQGSQSHAWDGGSGRGHIQLLGNGRLTGFRFRGWAHQFTRDVRMPGLINMPSGTADQRRAVYNSRRARGVNVRSSNAVIDNMQLWGFADSAISVGSASAAFSPTISHCHIHNCMMLSAGYGIDVFRGRPSIRFCYFDATRHAIDGFGYRDCGYLVEDCLFGPATASHAIDMHGLHNNLGTTSTSPSAANYHRRAGGDMIVRRCTFCFTHIPSEVNFDSGRPTWAVSIRGEPLTRVLIENCRLFHSGPQARNFGIRSFSSPAAFNQGPISSQFLAASGGFSANFTHRNNLYGGRTAAHRADRGAPIDLRNPPTAAEMPPSNPQPGPPAPAEAELPVGPWEQDPDPNRRQAVVLGGQMTIRALTETKGIFTIATPTNATSEQSND